MIMLGQGGGSDEAEESEGESKLHGWLAGKWTIGGWWLEDN